MPLPKTSFSTEASFSFLRETARGWREATPITPPLSGCSRNRRAESTSADRLSHGINNAQGVKPDIDHTAVCFGKILCRRVEPVLARRIQEFTEKYFASPVDFFCARRR